jgi:pimeloyl-ACP methyl ester carboxylesterase
MLAYTSEAQMQDTRVKVDQVELQVRDYEQGRDAILFLHFSGANLMMWQRAIPYFQDQYRLVLVDLRGHGKSGSPETGYHIDDMARDVIGIMQHLGLERAYIVGSSLGAEVGLSLAANYPHRVISLVCDGAASSEFGPYGTWEGSEAEFEAHVARQLEKLRNTPGTVYPSIDALVERSRQGLEETGWWNEVVEAVERYGAHAVEGQGYAHAFSRRAMAEYLEGYFHCRFEDYYGRVSCPVLMVACEAEPGNEREEAAMEGLRGLARNAQIVRLAGWEHPYGWMLNPDAVCRAILSFLHAVE